MQSALLHNGRGFCIGIAIFTKEYEKRIVEIFENKLKYHTL